MAFATAPLKSQPGNEREIVVPFEAMRAFEADGARAELFAFGGWQMQAPDLAT